MNMHNQGTLMSFPTMPPERLVHTVREIAWRAGAAAMQVYERGFSVAEKEDKSPLTEADLASHRLICAALSAQFPSIPIVSEEDQGTAAHVATGDVFWLVDPLDGTKEFVKRTGEFTVNIALIRNGVPVLGVVFAPAISTTYWAGEEIGAFKLSAAGDALPIQCQQAQGEHARIVASRDHAGPAVAKLVDGLPGAQCVNKGSSLKLCLVAEGAADIYLRDLPTMEWDTAAGHAVVRIAGGDVIDCATGEPLRYGKLRRRNSAFLCLADAAQAPRLLQLAGLRER